MIDIDNQTSFKLTIQIIKKLEDISTYININSSINMELLIIYKPQMKNINKTYRNIDKSTDVLSFPNINEITNNHTQNKPNIFIGSIIICYEYILKKAKEYNHSNTDEFYLLYIHGLLHLYGYDHEKDEGEHRSKEEEIIKKFKLPQSLCVRNS
jgi:probable rRNA maturation factor